MKKMQCLILMLVFFTCGNVMAQKTITGKITDKAGEPLNGVSVVTNNKKAGTTTKENGTYSIEVPSSSSSLVFSFVGYASQTVSISGKSAVNIELSAEEGTEADVVVIGYGTQKKSSVTGAVSKFKNERLDEAPVSRLDQALQGKIAGVQIQNVGSEAGVAPKIRIRGLSSINAGANPLVVVDGVPVPDGLSFVNSADVESVEVLKDAASAAIYGSRGASGVILITTKSGKSSKPKYTFKYSQGQKTAYKLYDIMTATQWANLLFSEAELKKLDPSVPAVQLTTTGIATNEDRAGLIIERDIIGKSTDWQDYAIRNAQVRNIEMSVSGGNKDTKYYFSGIYQKDQGMMINSEYDRFSVRSKIDAKLSNRVKLTLNFNPSYIKREAPSERLQDFVRFRSWLPIFLDEKSASFVRQLPANANLKAGDWSQARYFSGLVYSGVMPDGSNWTSAPGTVVPFNTANQTPAFSMEAQKNTTDEYRLLSSADLTINILPGLDFKTLVSGYATYTKGLNFSKRDATRAGDVNSGVYDDRINVDLLNENTLNYNKKIKAHNIGLLAGFTAQKTSLRDQRVVGLDYPSDNITTLNTALSIDRASSFNTRFKTGLVSYLGRATYAYNDKYLLAASFRRDGSSYFAPGKKWGNFPSISAGWVASNEKFLKSINWLSSLKLRGSYGLSGNNRIVDFAYLDILSPANYSLGAGTGSLVAGQAASREVLPNPDLTWERTFQYNGGIDLALFKSALSISLDVYQSKTEALLLRQASQAFTGVPFAWNNLGKLQNSGMELEITSNNFRKKNFNWTTSANISFNRNKVLELGTESRILNQGERTELYLNKVGAPLVQFFGYVTDGVWTSQAQIDAEIAKGLTSPLTPYFVPGGLRFKDINGDNKINSDDRTVIGNPYPDYTWGVTNSFKYKNFDVSFLLQGVQGGQLVNGDANYLEIKRTTRAYSDNRWVSALYPGDGKTPVANVGFQNWLLTDYALEDASYWALREVGMGYTFPAKWIKRAKLNNLRMYFSGQNLFFNSAKSFRALNPEARTSTGPYNTPLVDGYQRGAFPVNKAFLFGIDITF